MLNRRKFIQQTALSTSAVLTASLLPAWARANEDVQKLTILHTNDVHSRIDPFPMDGSRNQGMGGVAARAKIIKQIRNENEHVLLLDAGDIFQGTPYFNVYKGEPEMKAMEMMGYDAATMGNHDFDGGMENFATQLKHVSFPILIANYDFTGTPLAGKTQPYKIFKKGSLKIGVFGLGIELKGLVPESLSGSTVYLDPIEAAKTTVATLQQKGCDMIICLSHLGYKYREDKVSDERLAQQTSGIDLIIGGHTHTFLDKPVTFKNAVGKDVLVNQVGFAGINLGRLDYAFSSTKKNKLVKSNTVVVSEKSSV
jgi:5'-nucleotidase